MNVLAGLSDARDSFAAAWDAEDEEPKHRARARDEAAAPCTTTAARADQ